MQSFEEDGNYKVKIFVGREPCEINVLEWGDPTNENVLLCFHGLTRSARDFSVLASFFKKKSVAKSGKRAHAADGGGDDRSDR